MAEGLIATLAGFFHLFRARAAKGDLAPIDADRIEVEHLQLVNARDKAASDLETARAACATLTGHPCTPFDSPQATRAFLDAAVTRALPTDWSDGLEAQRPDLAALGAAIQAARDRETLAHRRAIPDVTARLGYMYDTFVASGNQSLGVGIQVPLPVFDRGQADLQAAAAALARAARTRDVLVETGRLGLAAATRQRTLMQERLRKLAAALDKARGVRDSLDAAQHRGGASLIDVLLARRAYQELLRDQIDVLGEAFAHTLGIRQLAGVFPRPAALADTPTT